MKSIFFLKITHQNSPQIEKSIFSHIFKAAINNDVKSIRKIAQSHNDQINYIFGPIYKIEYFLFFLISGVICITRYFPRQVFL